jgi:uncharacterized cofD-like protein
MAAGLSTLQFAWFAWKVATAMDRGWLTEANDQHLPGVRLHDKRVVTIGGGTGPFALLSTMKRYPCLITAIVTMSDSGGSSRRLMDEFGQLPFGDLRQALVALSRRGVLWRDVFTYRFQKEQARAGMEVAEQAGVSGHSLGNLIISALERINEGSLLHAITDAQELLDTAGNVLPVTLAHTTLCAELIDGTVICGETELDTRGLRHPEALPAVRRVFLRDETPACKEAIRAIQRADVIILGPGDLYTSILPNLLVQGIAETICGSEARKIYVCNLMTKHGETDRFRASDFVREVHRYLGGCVDRVVIHDGSFPEHLLGRYAEQHQCPVEADVDEVRRQVPDVVRDRLLAVHADHLVRHDAERLLGAIFAPSDADLPRPTITGARGRDTVNAVDVEYRPAWPSGEGAVPRFLSGRD